MLAVWLIISSMLYSLRLSNGGSFPKPLTAREEREYLERVAQGDLEARNVLIERNLRLVAHIMKKYYTQTSDQEDLISIGTIGLIKGISTFDPKKGARLATYAARCVENAMHPPGCHFPLPTHKTGPLRKQRSRFLSFRKRRKHGIQQRSLLLRRRRQLRQQFLKQSGMHLRHAARQKRLRLVRPEHANAKFPFHTIPSAGILCRGGGAYSGSFATSSSSASPSASSNVGCGRMAASSWRAVMPLAMV